VRVTFNTQLTQRTNNKSCKKVALPIVKGGLNNGNSQKLFPCNTTKNNVNNNLYNEKPG
jgi:hypothetical protein